MEYSHEVIFCIVNDGFADSAMEAAKSAGARGGTVISARGTASKEAQSFFHIAVSPEKEIVMILVPKEIRDAVLHAVYRQVGLGTPGNGIAFALPVDEVVGLSTPTIKSEE